MYKFTKDAANNILKALESKGYTIDDSLKDNEVHAVEKAFKALLPPDLKLFLQTGVIKGFRQGVNTKQISRPYYPDWRNPVEEAAKCQDWIERHVFRFDIENNNYWYSGFGEKPKDTEKAVQQALAVVKTWPPLFPIYGHRFIPSSPHKAGNPVLSVWQADDTIYYGANILDYMDREFRLGLGVAKQYPYGVTVPNPIPVPIWGDAFDLGNTRPHQNENLTIKQQAERAKSKMPFEIAEAHAHSSQHRDEILNSTVCGCYDCLSIFKPSEIKEWLVNGTCAMCPKCDIDSVLGDASGFPITEEFLRDMNKYWFGGRVAKLIGKAAKHVHKVYRGGVRVQCYEWIAEIFYCPAG